MERLTVAAVRMVHGGRALATAPDGRRVLVAGAIPGERVRVVSERRRGVDLAEVEAVLEASPDRVPVPAHPGLDLGFVRYERQLELKREVVLDALRRALGPEPEVPELPPTVPSPRLWGYRATIQPAVVPGGPDDRTRLGYRRPGSHQLVPLDDDPTANDACRAGWEALAATRLPRGVREVVLRGNDEGQVLIALVATSAAKHLLDPAHALVGAGAHGVLAAPFDPRGRFRGGAERLAGARSIGQRYGDVRCTLTATSFAQPNPEAAHGLYRRLQAWSPAAEHALDLYAGNGVIAMHLAPRCQRVTALEIDRGAVDRGRRDARAAGLANVELARADAREVRVPDDVDLIAVDPPRAGLARAVRDAIDGSRAEQLIYVACDVATWARDVADLRGRGWRLSRLAAYDFQPHTHHVELLSLLTRGG